MPLRTDIKVVKSDRVKDPSFTILNAFKNPEIPDSSNFSAIVC